MTTMPDERREMAIICAVLHDVLDDTSVKYQDVQKEFGKQVAIMVNQITEISYLIQQLRRHRRRNVGILLSFWTQFCLAEEGPNDE